VPDLKYDYNALEPAIPTEIMQMHHLHLHADFVKNLKIAEESNKHIFLLSFIDILTNKFCKLLQNKGYYRQNQQVIIFMRFSIKKFF
jgi:superoxide dismutase